jgi:energy-coupling factor transport system substrate-specific component
MKTNPWSSLVVTLSAAASIMMFTWPLFLQSADSNQVGIAQAAFIALMPALLVIILVEFGAGNLDSRRLAVLGLLIALNSGIRLLGAGVSGIETAFFLIIIGGFVFGASFGFILGSGSLLVSALLGAGVGPWLPFQMMAAGLVGICAGLLGLVHWKKPLLAVGLFSVPASFLYGALMTMWNWPFLAGLGSSLSFNPGAPLGVNLLGFIKYELLTGGLLWDFGRAATTVTLIALTGKTLLATLNRAANRALVMKADLRTAEEPLLPGARSRLPR